MMQGDASQMTKLSMYKPDFDGVERSKYGNKTAHSQKLKNTLQIKRSYQLAITVF